MVVRALGSLEGGPGFESRNQLNFLSVPSLDRPAAIPIIFLTQHLSTIRKVHELVPIFIFNKRQLLLDGEGGDLFGHSGRPESTYIVWEPLIYRS